MKRSRSKRGLSLIEVVLALTLLGVVAVKVALVMSSASDASLRQSSAMDLEDRARRVLDKIAYAVMSADRDALFPSNESPNFSTNVTYVVNLGVDDDGEIIWSDPEFVGLSENGTQVVWRQNPGETEERRVSWCDTVRDFLEGELPNGADDNGNGLIDERGLTFTLQKDLVTVRLCLERPSDGRPIVEAIETEVTVRN